MDRDHKSMKLGKISADWSIKKVDDLAKYVGSGITPRGGQSAYVTEGIPFIRSQNVYPDGLKMDDIVYINEQQNEKMKRTQLKEYDILLNITGASIGRCTYVPPGFGRGNVNQHVCIIRADDTVDSRYLSIYINSPIVQKQIDAFNGGSSREGLNYQQVRELKILIPNKSEQIRIAEIILAVDEQIEITDNLIEKTKELKKSLMQRLLTRGIGHERFKDTEIGRIPEEWEVKKIKDISFFCSNGFVGTASPFYTNEMEGIPYLMSNNVRANKIDELNLVKISKRFKEKYPRSTIYHGDMLTVQSGHIGTSCIVPQRYHNANCHALIITRFHKSEIEPLFISYYLNSYLGYSRLSNIFVGTTIKHINVKDFVHFIVPVPPFQEQKWITSILSSTNDQIEQYVLKTEKLHELRKGLMQKLLTGKVRVKV